MKLKGILTAGLLGLSLLACGKKETEAPKAAGLKGSITVQAEETWKPYYEAAIARVKEANPEADIQLKIVGSFDNMEIIDKTDIQNEDVADVFAIPIDRFEDMLGKDALASFDAKALADQIGGFGDFEKGLGGALKAENSYFGMPLNIETLILGVNKTNGKDLNLKDVDFAELGPEVAMMPIFNAWWGVAITNAFDVELLGKTEDGKFFSDLTKDWSELSVDQKAMFEGMYNYWKESNTKKLPLFDSTAVYGFMDENFKTTKPGSVRIIGPWDLSSLTALVGEDLEVSGLNNAKFAGKMLKHWKGGWALVINARDEEDQDKLALSEAVIAEILNPEYAADFYKTTSKIMPNVSKDQYQSLDLSELDKVAIASVIDSFEGAASRPLFKEWGQVWGTWENAVLSWEAKKPANAEAAYKEIQASFKALLTNLGQ